MKKSVWIERLPQGYRVRFWNPDKPDSRSPEGTWFEEYSLAQKFAANKRLSLLSIQQGTPDPTLTPIKLFTLYLESLKHTHREGTLDLKTKALSAFFNSTSTLSPNRIKQWKTEMLNTIGINTVGIRLRELRAFCNWAVDQKFFDKSPFTGIEIPQGKEVGRKLEIEELQNVMEIADAKFLPYLLLLIHTGARRGEIVKAKWRDFDLDNGIWTIPAENSKSTRTRSVPIPIQLVDVLKKQLQISEYVFSGWAMNTAHWHLKKAVRKWNSTHPLSPIQGRIRLHDFRHTFASHWTGDPRVLMEMVGWKSMAMLKRYSHFNIENVRKAAETEGIGAKLTLYDESKSAKNGS